MTIAVEQVQALLNELRSPAIPSPDVTEADWAVWLTKIRLPPRCAKCGATMQLRSGPRGRFFGCSGYPKCKYTENIK